MHQCDRCGETFSSGQKLGGHKAGCKDFVWEKIGIVKKRKILLAEAKGICSRCRLDRWLNQPIPLEIDHIDGDSDNDSRENLRVLCLNCHGLTPTYRGKNRGRRGSKRKAMFDRHFKKKFGSVPQ